MPAMPNTSTSTELSYDDVLASVAALRGRSIRLTFMTASDPPQPIARMSGVVGGQQQDPDFPGVVHTRIRRNGPAGSFALDHDRFVGARWGQDDTGQILMVREGAVMIGIEVE
jgi:hypothetical protein